MIETHELVVPKSIPITLFILFTSLLPKMTDSNLKSGIFLIWGGL